MPDPILRVLGPGELGFTQGPAMLKTLLGSCVAVTLWHPPTHRGGMCHFLLPSGPPPRIALDARYGEDALLLLHRHFLARGIPPGEVQAGLFGGGDVASDLVTPSGDTIGSRNVATGRSLLRTFGYSIVQQDVRGTTGRTLILDPTTGVVEVRHHAFDTSLHGRLP